MSNAYSSQRDFEAGPRDEKSEESPHGVCQRSALRNPLRSMEHEDLNLGRPWFAVCQNTKRGKSNVTKASYLKAMWKMSGTTTLGLQKVVNAAMDFDFPDVQYILNALIGSFITLTAEGNVLQTNQQYNGLKGELWKVVGPTASILSEAHHAQVHVFSDSVLCLGHSAMSEVSRQFANNWLDNKDIHVERHRLKNSSTAHFTSTFEETSLQLLAANQSKVPSARDADGNDCTPETYSTESFSWV